MPGVVADSVGTTKLSGVGVIPEVVGALRVVVLLGILKDPLGTTKLSGVGVIPEVVGALRVVVLLGILKDPLGTTNLSGVGVGVIPEVVGALCVVVLLGILKDPLGILVLLEVIPPLGNVTVLGAVVLLGMIKSLLVALSGVVASSLVLRSRVVKSSLVLRSRVVKSLLVLLGVIPSRGIFTVSRVVVLLGVFKDPLGVLVSEVVALGSLKVLGLVVGLLIVGLSGTVVSKRRWFVLARFEFRCKNTEVPSTVPILTNKPTTHIFSDKLRSLKESIILRPIFVVLPFTNASKLKGLLAIASVLVEVYDYLRL
jgi:hypothetical protein